jgi:cation diffusion facilitator family transporter
MVNKKNSNNLYALGRRGAWVGIIGNAFLSLIKILAGIIGKSYSLISDGLHSLSDITSSLAVLFGMIVAAKPKDKEHPYGHGKAESITSLTVAVMLVVFGLIIGYEVVSSYFKNSSFAEPAVYTLWIAIFSVMAKEGMYRYKINLGKKIKSTSLIADAWHHRSDAFSSAVVVIALVLTIYAGEKWAFMDRIGALVVAGMILYAGIKVYLKAASELMDESVDPEIKNKVKKLAATIEGVRYVETLLVRKAGLDFLVDIHIEVDANLSVLESHAIAKLVKNKILQNMLQVKSVLVHVEPYEKNSTRPTLRKK